MWLCCVRRRASSGIACTFGEKVRDRTHHLDDKTDKTKKIEVHTHMEHTLPLAYVENIANYRLHASARFICFAFSFTVLLLYYFREIVVSRFLCPCFYTRSINICVLEYARVRWTFFSTRPATLIRVRIVGGPAGPKNIRDNIGDSNRRVLPSARSSCLMLDIKVFHRLDRWFESLLS